MEGTGSGQGAWQPRPELRAQRGASAFPATSDKLMNLFSLGSPVWERQIGLPHAQGAVKHKLKNAQKASCTAPARGKLSVNGGLADSLELLVILLLRPWERHNLSGVSGDHRLTPSAQDEGPPGLRSGE